MAKGNQFKTTFMLPRELHTRARIRALQSHLSFTDVMRRLLEAWLNGLVDIENDEDEEVTTSEPSVD